MDLKSPDRRKGTAIRELAPNSAYHAEADGAIIEWLTPDIPQPSEADIDAKVAEYKIEYDSKQYQRDRDYPSIGEQLDMQYWDKKNGTKKWEEAIDKVKSDHPKPTE